MSTEYHIEIRRKSDNKLIRRAIADCLKSIMDSPYSKPMHFEGRYDADKVTFDYEDVEKVEQSANEALDKYMAEYFEKKMSVLLAQNVDVKREIEDDLHYLKQDYIDEAKSVIAACGFVEGLISALVEDELVEDPVEKYEDGTPKLISAYKSNASDLPKVKKTYGDGHEYEETPMVFNRDVYMTIRAYS